MTGTGTGTERDSQCGRNGTGNGEREGPVRAGRAMGKGGKKCYVGQGCAGVLRIICGGGGRYGLGIIILETAGKAEWSRP